MAGSDSDEWVPRLEGYSPDEVRDWISTVARFLETTPTGLAKAAKVAPSTVNRFVSRTSVNENLSVKTIEKLALGAATLIQKRINQEDAPLPPRPRFASRRRAGPVTDLLVRGAVEAGVFRDAFEWPFDDMYPMQVPVPPAYRGHPLCGLEVRGPSMNRVYPEGTILICVEFRGLGREPRPGERVVVQKHEAQGIEATVKEFAIDPNSNVWLIPLSHDPAHQKPIYIGPVALEPHTDDSLVVSYLVIGSYQTEAAVLREK